jgi:hypothetical protein
MAIATLGGAALLVPSLGLAAAGWAFAAGTLAGFVVLLVAGRRALAGDSGAASQRAGS